MPGRDENNKPHSALVEKYTNREYSSLMNKNVEPQNMNKSRLGDRNNQNNS